MDETVEVSAEDLQALGEKLEALDLTDAERAVLDEVLERAAAYEPEVEGFSQSRLRYTGLRSGSGLVGSGFDLGLSAGFVVKVDPPKDK